MTEWSMGNEWSLDNAYQPSDVGGYYPEKQPPAPATASCYPPLARPTGPPPPSPALKRLLSPPQQFGPVPPAPSFQYEPVAIPRRESPRELRNQAEKQRRDTLSRSISELASLVPPVVAANRKIDKTGVLRLTAHYLRAHQHVFGDSIQHSCGFHPKLTRVLLSLLRGFLITTTYKGIIVVASQNVQEFLGYSELDLLGQKIMSIVHPDDHQLLLEQLKPRSVCLGPAGELQIPDGPDGNKIVADALANEKRKFIVRFKKLRQRSDTAQYISCVVEGNLRKSDRACKGPSKGRCQPLRRARARGVPLTCSGNDIVFIGLIRPMTETFMTERSLEAFRMAYKTRHSIDGEIIQVDNRISLVTGYMANEVHGVNAMNFMHRDDVRWVVVALRDMYEQNSLFGESCYRLITKNGQFIYMRTQGMLDVDKGSRAVTSFVCMNTQVEEREGKELIAIMKQRFMMQVENEEEMQEYSQVPSSPVFVEDPKQLERVILELVTNLPSPQSVESRISPDRIESHDEELPLAIIPPHRERIVSAIEKIYGVIKVFPQDPLASMDSTKPPKDTRQLQSPTLSNPSMAQSAISQVIENASLAVEDKSRPFAAIGFEHLPGTLQKRFEQCCENEVSESTTEISVSKHGGSDKLSTDLEFSTDLECFSSCSPLIQDINNSLEIFDLQNVSRIEHLQQPAKSSQFIGAKRSGTTHEDNFEKEKNKSNGLDIGEQQDTANVSLLDFWNETGADVSAAAVEYETAIAVGNGPLPDLPERLLLDVLGNIQGEHNQD